MNAHTPGPWIVAPSSNPKNGTDWRDIHSLGGAFSPSYVGEALKQDADLIAASPDLLAALESLLDAATEFTIGCNCQTAQDEFALGRQLEAARNAIAKAKGTA